MKLAENTKDMAKRMLPLFFSLSLTQPLCTAVRNQVRQQYWLEPVEYIYSAVRPIFRGLCSGSGQLQAHIVLESRDSSKGRANRWSVYILVASGFSHRCVCGTGGL